MTTEVVGYYDGRSEVLPYPGVSEVFPPIVFR